jgi:hypothetical protein
MATRALEASTRPERFPIRIPVRYRKPHTPQWLEAWTENVSRSGVLFRTDSTFKPTTNVEVTLKLPPTRGDGAHAWVVCKGEVVRVDQTHNGEIAPTLAVAIHHYRLTRKWQPN